MVGINLPVDKEDKTMYVNKAEYDYDALKFQKYKVYAGMMYCGLLVVDPVLQDHSFIGRNGKFRTRRGFIGKVKRYKKLRLVRIQ